MHVKKVRAISASPYIEFTSLTVSRNPKLKLPATFLRNLIAPQPLET